jgi:transposase InsO family protein
VKAISVPPPGVGGRYRMDDGRLYEVINVTRELVSFRDTQGTRTRFLTPEDLKGLMLKKQIVLAECPPIEQSAAARFVDSSEPDVLDAQRKDYYVLGIRNTFQGALPRAACVAKLKALAVARGETKAPSYTTLWRWTALSKQGNWSPWSLLKQKSHLPRGKQTPEAVRCVMLRVIDEAYDTEQKLGIAMVYLLIKGAILNDNIVRSSTHSSLLSPPSLSTVRRTIKRRCHYQTDRLRLGAKAAAANNKFGPAWQEPEYLLDEGEIDCKSPCDIMIVDEQGNLLGKVAHFQGMIEVKSGKLLGHELSLMPPCAGKTLKTLRMSLQDVPGEELERGKLVKLTGDRGSENNNINVKTACKTLGIQLVLPPPGVPDARPHIEAFNNTVNTFFHTLPGTTFSNPEQCGQYDSAAHACLTIEQLQEAFEDWLENVYHTHPLIRGRTKLSPNARWAKAMAQQLQPIKYSEKELNAALRSTKHRRIHHGVVGFDHLQWSGPGLPEIEHDLKPNQPAILLYDVADLGQVWVHHPDRPDQLVPADARDPSYQNGLSLYEHLLVMDALAVEHKKFSADQGCIALVRIRQNIKQIEKEFFLRKKLQAQERKAAKKAGNTVAIATPAPATTRPATDPPVLPLGVSLKTTYIEDH